MNQELKAAWHRERVCGATQSFDEYLTDGYRWRREKGWTAEQAIAGARDDAVTGKARYPRSRNYGNGLGARTKDGLQWCEDPSAIGLRFVCFADECGLRSIDHTGWFIEDEGASGETYRGVVYQFPGRKGKPVFVAGYREGSQNNKRQWRDTSGEESARLDLSDLIIGEHGEDEDAKQDAARRADHIAEREAEKERDYQRAWQAGSYYADTKREIESERESVLELLAERKAARAYGEAFPAICGTIRERIRSALRSIAELRERRDSLAAGEFHKRDWYLGFSTRDSNMREAFNEGAGAAVL